MVVSDFIDNKEFAFRDATGLDVKFSNAGKYELSYKITVYSDKIAKELHSRLLEHSSIENSKIVLRDGESVGGDNFASFSIKKWIIEIPFSEMNSEFIHNVADDSFIVKEIAPIASTLRDHVYAFMTGSANLSSCKRVVDEQLGEAITHHSKDEQLAE